MNAAGFAPLNRFPELGQGCGMRARGSNGRSIIPGFHGTAGDELQAMKAHHRLSVKLKGGCRFAQLQGSQANVTPGLPQAEPVGHGQLLSCVGSAGTVGQHCQRFGFPIGSLLVTGASLCH
jgi:hypothetical protein